MLVAATVATMMWAAAAQRSTPEPSAGEGALPVSAQRVYEGLQRVPLKIPPVEPPADFRITIEEQRLRFETVLEAVRRGLGAQLRGPNPAHRTFTGAQPLIVSPNLIDLAKSLVNQISAARRARAERITRREIAEELAAFCAEHDCSVYESGPDPHEGMILPGGPR